MNIFDFEESVKDGGVAIKSTDVGSTMPALDSNPIIPYLVDARVFFRNLNSTPIPPSDYFAKDNLATLSGMGWLNTVDITLESPKSNDLSIQESQLNHLFDQIIGESLRITSGFASYLPEGFNEPVLSFDLETTGLDTRIIYDYDGNLVPKVGLVGFSIATSAKRGYYFPLAHTEGDMILNWNIEVVKRFIDRIHQSAVVIYHNSEYDREVCAINGINGLRPFPYFLDTQLLDYLFDVNDKRHNLKGCSEKRLGVKMIKITELFAAEGLVTGEVNDHINFDRLAATTAYVYGGSDALQTYALFQWFASQEGIHNVFINQPIPVEIDHKTVDALRNLYRIGMPVNVKYAINAAKDSIFRSSLVEKEIVRLAGRPISVSSPSEISYLLFDEFMIPVLEGMVRGKPTKKYPKGLYSTGEELLEDLQKAHPDYAILNLIVLWRKVKGNIKKNLLKVALNFYVDAFSPWTKAKIAYSQTVIPTGRLSSKGSSDSSGKSSVVIRPSKNKSVSYSCHKGDFSIDLNVQGIPNPRYSSISARRITKIPESSGFDLSDLYGKDIQLLLVQMATSI